MRIAITLGDPRGIGPEIVAAALRERVSEARDSAEFVVIGPDDALPPALRTLRGVSIEAVPRPGKGEMAAGSASLEAIELGVRLALEGSVQGLVTAPISKRAIAAAGSPHPGHTELLRERCSVNDVSMIMASETTPLGGPLRIALLTVHVALRDVPGLLDEDLVVRLVSVAGRALIDWWGIARPRLAFAGVNPHASEGGLFGDEEARIIVPAMKRLEQQGGFDVVGLFPADTVFRQCIDGRADLVVTPTHDVGLAVLKTLAPETGINVTAGLPFPRTSPDHGTAFDIAGRGLADHRSMRAAIDACVRFAARSGRSVASRPAR